jgi:hypothetical protein
LCFVDLIEEWEVRIEKTEGNLTKPEGNSDKRTGKPAYLGKTIRAKLQSELTSPSPNTKRRVTVLTLRRLGALPAQPTQRKSTEPSSDAIPNLVQIEVRESAQVGFGAIAQFKIKTRLSLNSTT